MAAQYSVHEIGNDSLYITSAGKLWGVYCGYFECVIVLNPMQW